MKTCLVLLVLVTLFILFAVDLTDGRGGRGGGGRGGRFGGRSRSGGSRSSRSGRVSRYRGPSFTRSNWKTALVVGTVFGGRSYMRRRRYMDHPNREPTICFNENNLKNGTLGYFVCPMAGQDDSMEYCCGEDGNEVCCRFFDSPGRTAGVVIGILAFCAVIGVAVFCFCKHCKHKLPSRGHVVKAPDRYSAPVHKTQQVPLNQYHTDNTAPSQYPNSTAIPTTQTYGVQPGMKGQVPPPVGFDDANGELPYSPHPGEVGKPLLPPGNDGGLMYPLAPNAAAPSYGYGYQPPQSQGLPYPASPPPPYDTTK